MATTYDYSKTPVDVSGLTQEIGDAGLALPEYVLFNVGETPTNLHITFESALSGGDKSTLDTVVSNHTGQSATYPPTQFDYWLENPTITDETTGITGPAQYVLPLVNRRELFNDTDNPLYIPGHQPILGVTGILQTHADEIANMDAIHGVTGWHEREVKDALYDQPRDMLFYYGWLNSFNSAELGWNNEKVAQAMAKYRIIVFGDGIQDPGHGDYSNTQVIIPRIKGLNPSALVFGYVTTNQVLADFKTKTDQWNTLAVDGIFMDESGYDYGKTRSEFNERVEYVHGKSSSNIAFANAWNTDHVLGTVNDPSYPNSTYNDPLTESALTSSDWVLLESFAINTTAYSGNGGYESGSQWAVRGVKMQGLRAQFGVNMAAVGIINNANSAGQDLFDFGFLSALMWSMDAWGSSDASYGAGSSAVKFWGRPEVASLGRTHSLNGAVQVDVGDADVYHRYVERAKLSLDFSTSAQEWTVERSQLSLTGPQGPQGFQGAVGAGLQGPQGLQGFQGDGLQGPQGQSEVGIQGFQGPQGGVDDDPVGETYLSNNSTETSISVQDTWYDVGGTWSAGELNDFTHSGGVLTAQTAGIYRVVVSISALADGQNQDIEFGISINNGTPTAKAVVPRRLSAAPGAIPLSCILNISASDTVRLKLRNTTGTANVTVGNCNLNIKK